MFEKKIWRDRGLNRGLLDLESNVLTTRPSAHITVIQEFCIFHVKFMMSSAKSKNCWHGKRGQDGPVPKVDETFCIGMDTRVRFPL